MNKDYIYHHGILGMRWGKRNGPPYPLSPGQHSASEKKVGWKKSLDGKKNKHLYDRNEAEQARKRYWKKKGYSSPPPKKNSVVESQEKIQKKPRKTQDAQLNKPTRERNNISKKEIKEKKYAESKKGAKEYKKIYVKYSKEGYLKSSKMLEKTEGTDKYFDVVDSIQEKAIKQTVNDFFSKYGTLPNEKYIPGYMSENVIKKSKG